MDSIVRAPKEKMSILKYQAVIVKQFKDAAVQSKRDTANLMQTLGPILRTFSSADHQRKLQLREVTRCFLQPIFRDGRKLFGGLRSTLM